MMEDELIEILESFGCSAYLRGSLNPEDPIPDDFFIFWDNGSRALSHYDNREYSVLYDYGIVYYSTNPSGVYSVVRDLRKELKARGWQVDGDGFTVDSGISTHDGRGIEATHVAYIERN